MKTPAFNTTVLFYPNKNPKLRLLALWYFTTLMIVWNILGHTYLGFEQSHAAVIVGIGAAIFMQFFLEWVDATAQEPRGALGRKLGKFFQRTSRRAHSGFRLRDAALSERTALADYLCGRRVHRLKGSLPRARWRRPHATHFQSVKFRRCDDAGVVPASRFRAAVSIHRKHHRRLGLDSAGLHSVQRHHHPRFFTGRLPLVAAWVIGFALQGQIRALPVGTPASGAVDADDQRGVHRVHALHGARSGDHAAQAVAAGAFGFAVAMVYGVIQMLHLVFGLFFALLIGLRHSRHFAAPLLSRSNRANRHRSIPAATQTA